MTGALVVTAVAGGTELDRVTLDDEGRLTYRTGAAREMFERRRAVMGGADTDVEVTDAEVADALTGWSNGYIAIRPAGESADQPQG